MDGAGEGDPFSVDHEFLIGVSRKGPTGVLSEKTNSGTADAVPECLSLNE